MRKLRATYLFDPPAIADGWAIMRITAGYAGEVLLMCREHPWPAPGTGPARPTRYRADCWLQDQVTSVTLVETEDLLMHVQTLPSDRWLIAKCRTKSEQDANARVYDPDGELEWSFHAGDGIKDVQTTADGQIWVSYFDEGVFGRLPLGHEGLVCFDQEGGLLFRYNHPRRGFDVPPIHDCYALNVATRNDTWVYYYSQFPLVHLQNREVARVWPEMPIRYAKAFAVARDQALLSDRRYQKLPRFFTLSLDSLVANEVSVVDEEGDALTPMATDHACFGRAHAFYIWAESGLYVIDVRETASV